MRAAFSTTTTFARHYPEPQPAPRADLPPSIGTATSPGSVARSRPLRRNQRYLIVVDAGHGGVDPGMTGPIGGGPRIVEKEITLSVAQLLARELRESGVEVLMTRTSDTLIALSDRGRIA